MHYFKPGLTYVRDYLLWPSVVHHDSPGIHGSEVALTFESISVEDMFSAKTQLSRPQTFEPSEEKRGEIVVRKYEAPIWT